MKGGEDELKFHEPSPRGRLRLSSIDRSLEAVHRVQLPPNAGANMQTGRGALRMVTQHVSPRPQLKISVSWLLLTVCSFVCVFLLHFTALNASQKLDSLFLIQTATSHLCDIGQRSDLSWTASEL